MDDLSIFRQVLDFELPKAERNKGTAGKFLKTIFN